MKVDKKINDIDLVCNLDLEKYLGVWYEIAKLAAKGQMGLDNVTATYSLKNNKKIKVYNKGYKKAKKRSITGSAWVRDESCSGGLFVRFFWPFKSQYNVIKLADDYSHAVVMGDSKDSLWILSRSPQMEDKDYKEIINFLKDKGFKTEELLITTQNRDG